MAIYKYRISNRGRSRTLDLEKAYTDILFSSKDATKRLQQIRKATKGFRDEAVLGSYTSAPDFVNESLELLEAAQDGRALKPKEAEFIRETVKTLKELGSKQERVYSRALAGQIMQEYEKALESLFGDTASDFTNKLLKAIKDDLKNLSEQKQQEFFTSRYYQDIVPKKRYENVLEWSKENSGRKDMTYQEAWAYLFHDRLQKFIAG